MTSLEKLKEKFPALVQGYSEMNKEQLLEQICAEVLDLHGSIDRVQLFMIECTDMTKTNYTLDVIKKLIVEKKERNEQEFCHTLTEELDESYPDEDILKEVKENAQKFQDFLDGKF